MPIIQCPKCMRDNELDTIAYWDYKGEFRCYACGINMRIEIKNGHLQGTPVIFDFSPVDSAPPDVNMDFIEAQKCQGVEAYRATVVMCRRALEAVADSKGARGKNLFEKIEDLYNRGIISKGVSEIATQIRQLGNYGAHPKDDLLGGITSNDAGVILEFTHHLLKDVYGMPAKIEDMKKRLQQ